MKTIGLLGGMSWESTVTYYRLLNEGVKERLGGLHSARLVLWSIDFEPMAAMMREGMWDEAGALLGDAAAAVERAGAELLILCTNTLHKVAPAIEARVTIPFLHIVDVTAAAIKARGLKRVALLGTKFTMEQPFYSERLESAGLEVLVPGDADRAEIHRIIFDELVLGMTRPESRSAIQRIIAAIPGAEGVILGCTELGLVISPTDVGIPVFDTTEIHARAAVEGAVG